jgi:L-lactate dehydrogenase (cytochrome)
VDTVPDLDDAAVSAAISQAALLQAGMQTGKNLVRYIARDDGARAVDISRDKCTVRNSGVAKAIDIIAKELNTTMGLCGVNTIAEIDERVLAD